MAKNSFQKCEHLEKKSTLKKKISFFWILKTWGLNFDTVLGRETSDDFLVSFPVQVMPRPVESDRSWSDHSWDTHRAALLKMST